MYLHEYGIISSYYTQWVIIHYEHYKWLSNCPRFAYGEPLSNCFVSLWQISIILWTPPYTRTQMSQACLLLSVLARESGIWCLQHCSSFSRLLWLFRVFCYQELPVCYSSMKTRNTSSPATWATWSTGVSKAAATKNSAPGTCRSSSVEDTGNLGYSR